MKTYFVFSDENGAYKQERSEKFLGRHPYYIRTSVIIDSQEWKILAGKKRELLHNMGLPVEKEIKWSYLWSIRQLRKSNKEITEKDPFKFLDGIDYHDLIDYVENYLSIMNLLNGPKIIITYTDNRSCDKISEIELLKMHLQEHIQRIEMEISNEKTNVALIFVDPLDEKKRDEHLKDVYYDFFCNGDNFIQYDHIIDTLVAEHSHRNCGIQLADYIAGASSSIFKSIDREGYERGVTMFKESVYPFLRRSNDLNQYISGYGIREVPRNDEIRNRYMKEFKVILS